MSIFGSFNPVGLFVNLGLAAKRQVGINSGASALDRATQAVAELRVAQRNPQPQSRAEGDEPVRDIDARLARALLNLQAERDKIADAQQAADVRALRPEPQITREPVPVVVPRPAPAPAPVPRPAPQITREPVPVVIEEKEPMNGFELLPFLNTVGQTASALGGLFGSGNRVSAPHVASFGPAVVRAGQAASGGSLVSSFLGIGGGNGTPLQRARDATGRSVSRKQIILAARHCGLDVAASTFGISVEDVCMVVAKGMPRRSRGISSTDMRRTRSTLTKMNTMTKSLRGLCPPARRRS